MDVRPPWPNRGIEELHAEMIAHDMSNRQAARLLEVEPATVGRWLSGRCVPSLMHCARIHAEFGIPIDEFSQPAEEQTVDSPKPGE